MNGRRLKFHYGLWGFLLLGCGLVVGATVPPIASANSSPPPDPELKVMLRGVEERYNHLKTLRLHFEQTYLQGQQIVRQEAGTLYLRKPGKMRWEYENPEPKLFLSDGHRLTLYVPEEKRVTQTQISKSDDLRSPMRFLLGKLHFQKEFQQIERVSKPAPLQSNDTVIKAVPKRMRDRLQWVIMEISPQHQIRRLILREVGGVEEDFRFSDETRDLHISPDLFHFHPPPGTEVIRQ